MKIKVYLFAAYRELAGQREVELDLEPGSTVAALTGELRRRFPRLAPSTAPIVAAVNAEYAEPHQVLQEGDEVALIPPVSGGSPMIQITERPLTSEEVTAQVRRDTNGGVVTFLGTTRRFTRGKQVLHLEYEAYRGMALKKLEEIAAEVRERWGIEDVAIAHRIGRLEVEEVSLVVAVASPHRREAFAACQYAVDRIKAMVPIWKKEFFQDGQVWVGTEEEEHALSAPEHT
ncbi:MAG: molybdopterin converting factor subunit 1 [Dehalococcoidia bacterium]